MTDIFCLKLARFEATLVAPWFLKETYKLDPLWIRFFVLYKIDEWAQVDSGTPSTPKLVFCGPRSRWKMDPKVATFKPQKTKNVFSTLVGFLAMECQWTCIGWLLIDSGHGQDLAQHTFGTHMYTRASPNRTKWLKLRSHFGHFLAFFTYFLSFWPILAQYFDVYCNKILSKLFLSIIGTPLTFLHTTKAVW